MLELRTPLISEFLKDHRQFSRLIYEISKLLESGEIELARRRATELDLVAGPHIKYEETQLYSRLEYLGVTSVSEEMLVAEHDEMLEALRLLLETDVLNPAEMRVVKTGFQSALEHAEHCGSLISLMARLDEDEQASSLTELKRLRQQGSKWTDK